MNGTNLQFFGEQIRFIRMYLNQTLKKKFVGVNYIFYFMFDDSKIDRYLSTTSVTLNIQYFPLTFHSFFIRTRLDREYSRVILSNCFAISFKTTFVLFRKFSQTSKYHKTLCKVWRLKKQTTFAFVQFRTISSFFGKVRNYLSQNLVIFWHLHRYF